MAIATFKHSRITGLSTVVPDREIRLEDETAYYGGDARKVQRLFAHDRSCRAPGLGFGRHGRGSL